MPKVLTAAQMGKCIGCYSCVLACAREVMRDFSPAAAAISIKTRGGYQTKFTADLCRACAEPPCAAACRYQALVPREGGGARLLPEKCVGCGECAQACPINYLRLRPDTRRPIMCRHCGVCVRFCPHGVLELKEVG
ncbi:MAG: 4Fe-4S binding protein [Moorellales bacterium]